MLAMYFVGCICDLLPSCMVLTVVAGAVCF